MSKIVTMMRQNSRTLRWGLLLGMIVGANWSMGWGQTQPTTTQPAVATQPSWTPITIKLKNVRPEEILQEFTRQTGVRFSVQPQNLLKQPAMQKTYSVTIENKPFWPAVRQVCELIRLFPEANYWGDAGIEPRITLTQKENVWGKRPVYVWGDFMAVGDNITYDKSVNLMNPDMPGEPQLNVQITLYADPRLRVAQFNKKVTLTEASDEKDISLLPTEGMNVNYYGGGNGQNNIWPLNVPLHWSKNMGTKLAVLKGTTTMTVNTQILRWEIKDVMRAKNISKKVKEVNFTFKGITKDQYNRYIVSMTSTNAADNGPGRFSQTAAFDYSKTQLLGADNESYRFAGGGNNGRNAAGESTYMLYYYPDQQNGNTKALPARYVVELPTDKLDISVPIEFKNLQLP